jgi:putative transposase
MHEKELREQAIKGYENGESAKEIYRSLGKSKAWFFKWLKRAKLEGESWSESQSRRPQKSPQRIDKNMEQTVIDVRKNLQNTLYAQIGALAISYQLSKKGIKPPPISTINKIIKRNNLIPEKNRYNPKGVDYPYKEVKESNILHQFDLIGPRYLKNDGRFYSGSVMDVYDRRISINPTRRQTKIDMANTLNGSWRTMGISCYLQMDNILSLRGSNQYPHSLGLVMRLCLYLGIEPIFIPIREPWRNGIVEHFQNVFDKMFFRTQYFKDFTYLCEQAKDFEKFHNQNHHYSTIGGMTPNQKFKGKVRLLPTSFRFPNKLVIVPGKVHLIRFIRSNRILDIFGEGYIMPQDVVYEYVWATIDTGKEILSIYHDSKLIVEYPYLLPKSSIDLSRFDL